MPTKTRTRTTKNKLDAVARFDPDDAPFKLPGDLAVPLGYWDEFAHPEFDEHNDQLCLSCGITSTFKWGIRHGEGACSNCSWPARAFHFFRQNDGTDRRVICVLQYHPSGVVRTRRKNG